MFDVDNSGRLEFGSRNIQKCVFFFKKQNMNNKIPPVLLTYDYSHLEYLSIFFAFFYFI